MDLCQESDTPEIHTDDRNSVLEIVLCYAKKRTVAAQGKQNIASFICTEIDIRNIFQRSIRLDIRKNDLSALLLNHIDCIRRKIEFRVFLLINRKSESHGKDLLPY